ncbi:acyltransferase family protein [Ulvibacter antarcticus]|uniref:Peptidoglycan/LPS O-acetylase OafA/YrhL n=1 Tax=Ulvibacter antarcticus TaxID=442714 RepID=A0A3L9YH54_9FLAO|nr:acyltransferase [Ulvibacter antarcticus]RMA58509.1 peptidoglycan/LPS O-acetylase OafA/YrhL [Ulvibacter antarcticus]
MTRKKHSKKKTSRKVGNSSKTITEEITKTKKTVTKKNLHLEAMRGILALMVLVSHVELIRLYFGHSDDYLNPIIYHLGRVAVTGFFVLSGYLITMSILRRIETNRWSVGDFYIGRIFRIWPLYFFVIILAIWVLPHVSILEFNVPDFLIDARENSDNYWYFLFFLPQIPLIHNNILPFAEPTWSIGVEEIFYIIIPWVFVFLKKRFIKGVFIFFIIFLIAKYIAIYGYELPVGNRWALYINFYRYDCIALGCLMGAMHFKKSTLFEKVNRWHLLLALASFALLFLIIDVESYDYFPFALCFGVMIAYLVNKNSTLRSPKWLVYVGTISYSLYLTHEIAIVFFINLGIDGKSMVAMYALSILGAILLASGIYYLIEKPFMDFGNNKLRNHKVVAVPKEQSVQ